MKDTIDLSEKNIDTLSIPTKYCVSNKLHDLHIAKTIATGYPPVPVVDPKDLKMEPIAIVCSGPSLKNTWEEIGNFRVVLTCSGAHDYLLERGIVPTYHMETDPREHKAVFTKNPRKNITYLIASSCHPAVFENLKDCDVRVWHVVPADQLYKIPRGHWMITGGCNVGLRALVMARLLGHIDVHVFGMDCSSNSEQLFHVNAHPNEPKKKGHRIVKVNGQEFYTSDVFLECARQFFKETMLLSDVKTTLHGEGLLQSLAAQKMADPKQIEERTEWMKKRGDITLALALPDTISEPYVDLNRKLHEENSDYGGHGDQYAAIVNKLVKSKKLHSVLDYGCGKGSLAKALDFPIWEYDPAIIGKEMPPRPAELVVCTDVLEHIEPDRLPAVLEDLRRVIKVTAFFSIHTNQSNKTLADGRNTHLIQQGELEWKNELEKYFDIIYCARPSKKSPWLYIVVTPKQKLAKVA